MSLLVGINIASGQISWKDALNKRIPARHEVLEISKGKIVDNQDLRVRLNQAKLKLGNAEIARTIFVTQAFMKTVDRKNLLTTAKEMGFGKCGIISTQAANCISSLSKFNISLNERERMAILTKGDKDQIICHYWQKIGSSIKSYIKPYVAKTEENMEVLKENLRKYVTITLIDAPISPKPFKGLTEYRVMTSDHNYWSSAALLKAGMMHFRTVRSVFVPDFIEKNFDIRLNGEIVKKLERPCLPFKTNIPLSLKKDVNTRIEVFEGNTMIQTFDISKYEKSNIQFVLDENAVLKVTIGPPLNHEKSNIAQAKLKNALRKRRAKASQKAQTPAKNGSGNDVNVDQQFDQWGNDTGGESDVEEIPMFECIVCYVSYEIEDGCFTCSNWENGDPEKSHTICRDCLENHAKTPMHNINPIADGIHCVDAKCKNVFILAFPNNEGLHECDICEHLGWINKNNDIFICECGISKCSKCLLLFDNDHKGKDCDEAKRSKATRGNRNLSLEERLSECVIRKCPKCNTRFEKDYGCNYMTCRCGTNMCYLCNEVISGTSHFCICGASKYGKCSRCQKTCRQFEDHLAYDERRLQNIKLSH